MAEGVEALAGLIARRRAAKGPCGAPRPSGDLGGAGPGGHGDGRHRRGCVESCRGKRRRSSRLRARACGAPSPPHRGAAPRQRICRPDAVDAADSEVPLRLLLERFAMSSRRFWRFATIQRDVEGHSKPRYFISKRLWDIERDCEAIRFHGEHVLDLDRHSEAMNSWLCLACWALECRVSLYLCVLRLVPNEMYGLAVPVDARKCWPSHDYLRHACPKREHSARHLIRKRG